MGRYHFPGDGVLPPWIQPAGTNPLSLHKRIPYYAKDKDFDYCARLWRGSELLIETVHRGLTSLNLEIDVMRGRIERGEATHIEAGSL